MNTFLLWFFVLVVILLGFVIWLINFSPRSRPTKQNETQSQPAMTEDELAEMARYDASPHRRMHGSAMRFVREVTFYESSEPSQLHGWQDFIEYRNFMANRDWDAARQMLQRIAYSMPGQSQSVKDEFTAIMREFAAQDPLVSGVLRIVMPILRQEPGMLQTQMYKHLPGIGLEEVRYALYFGEQLGILRRNKKGSSYKLYPAEYIESVR